MSLEPFFFGDSGHRLFGACHLPRAASAPLASAGVVLCQPFGQEAIRAHRALARLADLLAEEGSTVLRFDYFGCGDSEGCFEAGGLEIWMKDVSLAIEELKAGCSVRQVCLIGLRLGANLAWAAASERSDVSHVIAWNPIWEGATYLVELEQEHLRTLQEGQVPVRESMMSREEALGFPMTQSLRNDLAALQFPSPARIQSPNVLLLESEAPRSSRALDDAIDYLHVADSRIWLKSELAMPNACCREIAAWLTETTHGKRS